MNRYFIGLTISALTIVISIDAPYAQQSAAEHGHLPEVVLTADPLGETDSHLIQPVHVLDEKDLQSRNLSNIGEAVSNELGITSSDFGTGVGRPLIRGLGGSRVSILENGISTMDVADVSADHGVPSEPVFSRQIEILRGPATLLYGSAASGGVVNVVNDRILRQAPERLEADLSMQYESVSDGWTGAGQVNIPAGEFALHLDGMFRDTDDYDIPGFAELEPDEPGQGGSRAGCSGGSVKGIHRRRCFRILRMTGASSMTAMMRIVCSHFGHISGSTS